MNAARLELRGLTKRFGPVTALQGADLALRAGEVHALCGENGAGKSTLINVLSGTWPHGTYEGELRLEGHEVRFRGPRDAEAAGIAVIHQELALVPGLSVAENVFLGAIPCRRGLVDWPVLRARTMALLARFGLELDPEQPVETLGVGQQQLVEILKALAKDARILLLDEPTAALSAAEADRLLEIVRDLRRQGVACLYISHRLDEVFALADRLTVLRDGRTVATQDASATDRAAVIKAMVGRELVELFPRRAAAPGEVLLDVADLAVEVEGRTILEGISFQVRAGEVLGIGGLMGAGRSELLLHLFGSCGRRAAGTVRLRGRALGGESPGARLRLGLALVPEDRKRQGLVLGQGVGFNLSLASLRACSRRGLLDTWAERRAGERLCRTLAVKTDRLDTPVERLSGGNQQKVVLGKLLLTEPQVVLLDEPTRGIDVGAKVEVYQLINRLTAEGKAVVLVSSELPELLGMADRILVLSGGRPGGTFTRQAATQEALLAAALAGHARTPRKAP